MWPFSSRISPEENAQALRLIVHLQKMLAYQQLSMEVLNDSVGAITEIPTNEVERPEAFLDSTNQVEFEQNVLPALQRKLNILEKLSEEHKAFCRPVIPQHADIYDLFSEFFTALTERGKLQITKGKKWVANPNVDVDASRLDEVEKQSMSKSLPALNKLIMKHGLSNEDFLQINCEAFNSIREFVGLAPLPLVEFVSRYFAGMSGQRARFFTDYDQPS